MKIMDDFYVKKILRRNKDTIKEPLGREGRREGRKERGRGGYIHAYEHIYM